MIDLTPAYYSRRHSFFEHLFGDATTRAAQAKHHKRAQNHKCDENERSKAGAVERQDRRSRWSDIGDDHWSGSDCNTCLLYTSDAADE